MSDATPALWLERTNTRQYIAHKSDGISVPVGAGPGHFSPGDLLKISMAGCQAMSSDARFAHALGSENFDMSVGISGEYDKETDRYLSFVVELVADLSSLDAQDKERLRERAKAAIDRNCTIGHTLVQGATYETVITDEH
ncbi:MAG: OsmC family protein [Actinomycetaceae bacterium]|nr:OsmC family protein [Actinomycetaceae bacterium]